MFTTLTHEDFETVALPHLNDLYRAARHTLGNQTAAEDVVQETYLQAWKSFHRFAAGTNCRAWLFKILFHVIQHHRRKNWRLQTLGEREEFLLETLPYEAPLSQHLSDEEVLQALNRLPENFRAVILLADVEEFAYKEVARILNIPIGTVMSRLNRGRKLLRSELTSYAKSCGLLANGAAKAMQMGALAQAA
ncbi:MAG: sigma-70 family RNA polymerase sigma factor [Acidobacteria bacterium]|nr:sigma-70 family RNA polymerase sigma factor [Acidobacteriota bacterium]MBI3422503.1 sigma-70 family RNA polymerase sigma factor [Acidobacteriota bacterium]